MSRYGLYAVQIDGTVIGGITAENISSRTAVRADSSSGEPYARFVSITAQSPKGSFSTKHVASALTLLTVLGKALTGGSTHVANLYFQKRGDHATRATTGHRKVTISQGLVLPRRIGGRHGDDVSLSVDILATYDGTNDPIIPSENQTLPSITADAERFAIGKCVVGNIEIDEEFDVSIDFGLREELEGKRSEIWPRMASITDVSPSLVIRSRNGDLLKSSGIPLLGKAATHANTLVYLRKRSAFGTFVADATAEHIVMSACGMAHVEDVFDASGQSTGEVQVVVTPTFDGTNPPIKFNGAAAIA